MQGKKKLVGLFPILLIVVFLILTLKSGVFQRQVGAESPFDSEGGQTVVTTALDLVLIPSDSEASLPVIGRPSAGGVWQTSANASGKEELPAQTTPLDSEEQSVDAMAPQLPSRPLVTEFQDAYEVFLPIDTQKSEAPKSEKPALVTGFSGTLPLSLPLASPNVSDTEMRAVYVASAYNLDFPSRPGLSKAVLQKEIDEIVTEAANAGMNTVFFQVRPASDALYRSEIFPVSRYLAASEGGALALDALGYLIESAHAKGIKVHAWINPFRVRSASESDAVLSKNNPAKKNPALTFTVEGAVYYNPALSAVHSLIIEGVREILKNYDVDGILFDDYFYPENITDEDAKDYAAYQKAGGFLSLGDFRRENINALIESVYRAVKKEKPNCLFGVSPRGVWRNAEDDPSGSDTRGGAAYDAIYCDALAWVKGGYIDYLSPQIYWSFDHKAAPFATLADWWNKALSKSGVKLCVSLASYSLPKEEIARQREYLAALSQYGGFALYRYAYME
ncbi:MAG: family 10 glycosylhydrolase [Clostridia bacterium]|nr:family 10 glycosylhydrolase [Clostridia bacterium]